MPILLLGLVLFLLNFFGILNAFYAGWGLWILLLIQAITWFLGCRFYLKTRGGVTPMSLTQSLFFSILTIVFLLSEINKMHIIWLTPTVWMSVHLLAEIPIIGKTRIYADGIFFEFIRNTYGKLILLGIKQENIPDFFKNEEFYQMMKDQYPDLTKEDLEKISSEAEERRKSKN